MTSRILEANRGALGRAAGRSGTPNANRSGRRRAARSGFLGLSTIAVAAAFAFPMTLPAAADPALTLPEAKAQIEQLETDAAAIDQDYAGVQDEISTVQVSLKQKKTDAKAQTAKVEQMKAQVGQVALAQFQNRDLDTAAQLFVTDDTEGFLSQISTVEKVSENQNSVLQDFQQEQASLADLQHSTQTDLAALDAQQKQLASLRAASDKKVADAKDVLAKLTAEQQRQIALAEKRAEEKAKAEAEKAADPAGGSTPGTTTPSTPTAPATSSNGPATNSNAPAVAGSGRGAKALAYARAQLGKPYSFGATGPNAYDCSGLTGAAWRAAGVNLSRTSQSQIRDGRAVSQSELQPGDLVFFYSASAPSHVALYAGNGMIIHSPRPGKSVQYLKMSYMPFSGARRPG